MTESIGLSADRRRGFRRKQQDERLSRRLDPSWLVYRSIENFERDRCVDLFSRPDGSFGFEEFRRDAEDAGGWTAIRYFSAGRYQDEDGARAAARQAVAWFDELFRTV